MEKETIEIADVQTNNPIAPEDNVTQKLVVPKSLVSSILGPQKQFSYLLLHL